MAGPELPLAAIADAGPLIHLDELDRLDLLNGFREVLVPSKVASEAEFHRPGWQRRAPAGLRIADPSREGLEAAVRRFASVGLDAGELAALALWQEHQEAILLCDDLAARRSAEAVGCEVAGTLGLLLWSARSGRIASVTARELLEAIPIRSTLHLGRALLGEALRSLDDLD